MAGEDVTGNFVAGMLPDMDPFEYSVEVAGLTRYDEVEEVTKESDNTHAGREFFCGIEVAGVNKRREVDKAVEENNGDVGDWAFFGSMVPKNEVIFICQVLILYVVIVTCIINLSLKNGDSNLWVALLSSSLGIMLPQPTLSQSEKKRKYS